MLNIIFFAIVAIFIAWRLRSVLGRRTDMDEDRILKRKVDKQFDRNIKPAEIITFPKKGGVYDFPKELLLEDAHATAALASIASIDKGFTVPYFLDGAKKAFEMVLKAYVEEDERTLKNLLTKEVYEDFYQDIEEHRQKNERGDVTLVSVEDIKITGAALLRTTASITVTIVSEQIAVTRNRETGAIISGNPSQIDRIEDVWTFSRSLKSSNPNWKLSATSE